MAESLSLPTRLGKKEFVEKKRHSSDTKLSLRNQSMPETSQLAGKIDKKSEEKIRHLEQHVKKLTVDNRNLEKENQDLNHKLIEESRKLDGYVKRLVEENENFKEEIRRCKQREQELMEDIERCQMELTQSKQKLKDEESAWKFEMRAEQRKSDILAKLNDRLVAERGQLESEKRALARTLKNQSEEIQRKVNDLNGRITHLEEQLEVNRVAHEACMEFGYSHAMVTQAYLEWNRRYGYRAADLMKILMRNNERWNFPMGGLDEDVGEERQDQQDAHQIEQLEGAVGGQVAPSGCSYKGQS